MSDDENNATLDIYNLGWERGDSAIIYRVIDDSYTFSGLPNTEPVDKKNFKMFWVKFRSTIEDGGGPPSVSGDFMKFKNAIRKKVEDGMIESGQWEVPGFANGVYMSFAKNGKIMWEAATM